MRLTIVIPAFNEEEAIGSTIQRCLNARQAIIADAKLTAVEIIMVSDGSTDRTVEIARRFPDVHLIEFDRNQGYGAAIKAGFQAGAGELVGFLDADGTCDPRFFSTLCRTLQAEGASVAIGSRMGPDSRMPRLRRLGNRVYALILSILSNRIVTDTASGMRVIRQDVLSRLYPLPDGLHFTPAMSARVLMDDQLSIVEVPMPYAERIGKSKLSIVRDGTRFLQTIVGMAMAWRPVRLLLTTAMVSWLIAGALVLHPAEMWLRAGGFEEGMIYRLLFGALLAGIGFSAVSAATVANRVRKMADDPPRPMTFVATVLERIFSMRIAMLLTALSLPLLIGLVGPAVRTRILNGSITLHWSRMVLAGLFVFGLVQLWLTATLLNVARFHGKRWTSVQVRPLVVKATAPRESIERTPKRDTEPETDAAPMKSNWSEAPSA